MTKTHDDVPPVSEGQLTMGDAPLEGEVVPAVPRQSAFEILRQEIEAASREGVDADTDMMDRILGDILTAGSLDDVLENTAPLKGVDVAGEQLVVHGISFTESDVEDSRIPYYATLHAVRSQTGKRVVINCGGEQVLAQALWIRANATFPLVISVIQVGKEKAGRSRPYRLTWATEA